MRGAADSLDGILLKSVLTLPELLLYARLAEAPVSQLLPPLERLAALQGGLSAIPEPLLDLLAWQFHVDGYEAATCYEDKRRLVDRSILMHRRKGTPWAVAEALRSLGYADARILEGGGICHYDGEIMHDGRETYAAGNRWALFDVEIDLGDGMGVSAASVLRLRTAIEAWKNARSHLRSIRWKATICDNLDLEELLAILSVRPHFLDYRPWGFPCYDGSIRHDNAIFRLYDGRLFYDGAHPHSAWEACGHFYDNQIELLRIASSIGISSLVRPCLKYDGFLPHNGYGRYGHTDAPALDKCPVSIIPHIPAEIVPVRESQTTTVAPASIDWMFRCHNGSFTYGPHVMNGEFHYDGSHNYDSGIFHNHSGRTCYDGSRKHDRWLRLGPLHDGGAWDCWNIGGNIGLADNVRHLPDHSGLLAYDGGISHAAMDNPAIDSCSVGIGSVLLDELPGQEKTEAVIETALFDETGSVCHDGAISYGQKRVNIHDGKIRHDGSFVAGCFGGASSFRPLAHDGFARFNGDACHSRFGWISEPSMPVYHYRNLSDFLGASTGFEFRDDLGFADDVCLSVDDASNVSVAPALADDLSPKELCHAAAGIAATDWFGHAYDGSITHGQKLVGVHDGKNLHDGKFVSGPYDGMRNYSRMLHDGASSHDGCALHQLWSDALFSYRALCDSGDTRIEASFRDNFGLVDDFSLSIIRHSFHNGIFTHNASKPHCGKELL